MEVAEAEPKPARATHVARSAGRRRLRPRSETIVVAAVAVLIAATVVLALVVSTRLRVESRQAASAAGGFLQPSPERLLSGSPVVVVIGDDAVVPASTSTSAARLWTARIGDALPIRLVVLAQAGAAWSASDSTAGPFSAQAARVPADAALVLFVGGFHDEKLAEQPLTQAVAAAVGAARSRAPAARLVVIGPLVAGKSSADATSFATSLRVAATAAGAGFTDPIAQGWLPATSAADTAGPADQAAIARHIATVIGGTG